MASHLGDIRSLGCEQSRPAGEQSRSLELRYYRLVGPSAWKCTCRRAGLRLRGDTGGGGGLFWRPVCLSVSCQFVCIGFTAFTHTRSLFLFCSPHTHVCLLLVFSVIFYLVSRLFFLFAVSFFLFSSDHHHYAASSSPRVVLHSSPPSFKWWWAAEQYPGGHGDRQPPPCGLFLLLSLVLLLLGSCTLLTAHIPA